MDTLKDSEFELLAKIVQRFTGIRLNPNRKYLLEGRLDPFMRGRGLQTYQSLIDMLGRHPQKVFVDAFVDAVTINETSFFRDGKPFDALAETILPELHRRMVDKSCAGANCLNIWSAGCSSGQEAYTIGMVLKNNPHRFPIGFIKIVGTDISDEVIQIARRGVYSEVEVHRGLPPGLRNSYLSKTAAGWEVCREIRQLVDFRQENLLERPRFGFSADLIFCRNVTVYFSDDDRKRAFSNLVSRMSPGAILVTGTAEAADRYVSGLEPVWDRGFLYYRFNGA